MTAKRAERAVLGFLRSAPFVEADVDLRALFDAAERHGVGGVVLDAWRAAERALPAELARRLDVQVVARELDHRAHLDLLASIDALFLEEGLVGVILKGPMFAERYYARPSARATSDVDLLVDPRVLDRVGRLLVRVGYVAAAGPEEERNRREHHHLHFSRADALPLELHFHGYTGFGEILESPALVERRRRVDGLRALGVLEPADELVFLAVHAAAHRFVRHGWLYDLRLLTDAMSDDELSLAAARASAWGFSRVLAFTAERLVRELGADRRLVRLLGRDRPRTWLARRTVAEPEHRLLSSATRMLYTVALCDKKEAAGRYLWRASSGHVRRLLHLPP